MRKTILVGILISALLSISRTHAHDLKLALFHVLEENGTMMCYIKADRVQLIKALDYSLSDYSLNSYLDQHLSMVFDGVEAEFKVVSFELSSEFIDIKVQMENAIPNPRQIEMKNDFLIEEIEGHENIIRFNLNGRVRSYGLRKNKTETVIKYENI